MIEHYLICLGGHPVLPVGKCPECGGRTVICGDVGPTQDGDCWFVCSKYDDGCGYSGPVYDNLAAAAASEEAVRG